MVQQNKIFDFWKSLKNKDYDIVLIVAHSGVSKALSGYFEGLKNGKFLNRGLKNCEIKEYVLRDILELRKSHLQNMPNII